MTKWARMRRRKEKMRSNTSANSTSEENATKLAEPKKVSDGVKHYQQTQKTEVSKTSTPSTILSQIPRYVYLVAIFALISGVFFPLIITGADDALGFVIGGVAILFVGLIGGILIFRAATSNKRQGIFLISGLALIIISLTLVFLIQDWWMQEF